MELYYCESCGDIIRSEEETELSTKAPYLCERCRGGEEQSEPRANEEGGAVQTAAHVADEVSLGSLLSSPELELFSADTLARKKGDSSARTSGGTKAKIRLLDPAEAQEKAPPQATEAQKPHREEKKRAPVAPAARKVQFKCPSCGVTLAVKLPEKPCKLTCPRCRGRIVVEPGQLPRLAERGTQVIRKPSGPKPPVDLLGAALLGQNPKAGEATAQEQLHPPEARTAEESSEGTGGTLYEDDSALSPPRYELQRGSPRRAQRPVPRPRPQAMSRPQERLAEQSMSIGTLLKALVLGAVFAAPFYLWAAFLSVGKWEAFSAYITAFGEMAQKGLAVLFGS